MTVKRLRRTTTSPLSPQIDDLSVRRQMHSQPLFSDRQQALARRRLADLSFEKDALIHELPKVRLDTAHLSGLRVSVTSSGDDRSCGDDKADEHCRDDPAPTDRYAALRHARNRALRARGFRSISSAEGLIAFRFTSTPRARPPQVH